MKAIKAGLLIDGNGGEPIKNGVVLVEDGKITKVGSAVQVPVPRGAELLDASARTVMPGIFDGNMAKVTLAKVLAA